MPLPVTLREMGTSCEGCALAISHICCDAAFLVLSLLPVIPGKFVSCRVSCNSPVLLSRRLVGAAVSGLTLEQLQQLCEPG